MSPFCIVAIASFASASLPSSGGSAARAADASRRAADASRPDTGSPVRRALVTGPARRRSAWAPARAAPRGAARRVRRNRERRPPRSARPPTAGRPSRAAIASHISTRCAGFLAPGVGSPATKRGSESRAVEGTGSAWAFAFESRCEGGVPSRSSRRRSGYSSSSSSRARRGLLPVEPRELLVDLDVLVQQQRRIGEEHLGQHGEEFRRDSAAYGSIAVCSPRSTRARKSSYAAVSAFFQTCGGIVAGSGGQPLASPLRMSSLCANSWITRFMPGGVPVGARLDVGPRQHDRTARHRLAGQRLVVAVHDARLVLPLPVRERTRPG